MNEIIGSIIRIDKPKNETRGTHGWQVRLPTGVPRKYHSKLFSDNQHDGKDTAFLAAKEYRQEQLQKHPKRYLRSQDNNGYYTTLSVRNKSGRVGVFRTHSYHSKTGKKQEFWGAFCSIGPYGTRWVKNFYISTHGEEEAKRLAIEFRDMWEEAVQQGSKAIREFFAEYHDGWL